MEKELGGLKNNLTSASYNVGIFHLGIQYLNTIIAKRKRHVFISMRYLSLIFISSQNK